MKINFFSLIKAIKFIFSSLTPLVVAASALIIIGASLFVYDQIQTYNDRRLGAELIKNLKADSACSQTVKAGDKFETSFTFTNDNQVPIKLQTLQMEKALLGAAEKKFIWLVATNPQFSAIGAGTDEQLTYNFESLVVKSKSSLPLTLTFQAGSRTEAGAKPHTFVVYTGKIKFNFEHQMTIEAPCEIQVVYAD